MQPGWVRKNTTQPGCKERKVRYHRLTIAVSIQIQKQALSISATAIMTHKQADLSRWIIAWDGGTIFNYGTGQLEAGGYDGWYKEPVRQTTWYKYVDKVLGIYPVRDRIGYRQIWG